MSNAGTVVQKEEKKSEWTPRPSFRMYHANKTKNGAASQWELSQTKSGKHVINLELANQTGENANGDATFGWKRWDKETNAWGPHSSVGMQLGLADVSEMLTVLHNYKPKAGGDNGIYHQNDNGKSVLEFGIYEKDGKFVCYSLRVKIKVGEAEWVSVQHSVSAAEAIVLKTLLERTVLLMNNWF